MSVIVTENTQCFALMDTPAFHAQAQVGPQVPEDENHEECQRLALRYHFIPNPLKKQNKLFNYLETIIVPIIRISQLFFLPYWLLIYPVTSSSISLKSYFLSN